MSGKIKSRVRSSSHSVVVESARVTASSNVSTFVSNSNGFDTVSGEAAGQYDFVMNDVYPGGMTVVASPEGSPGKHTTVSGILPEASGGATFTVFLANSSDSVDDDADININVMVFGESSSAS